MTDPKCVWPSGLDKPICMIRYSHREFACIAGLTFENGIDDLDEYFGSFINDSAIGSMKFLEYLNAPVLGITVYVDSLMKTSYAVKAIKAKFNLIDSDLSWVREIED